MKYWVAALTLAGALSLAPPAGAVSVSGIVLYAATDFGDPNGFKTLEGEIQAQLWRTMLGGDWHGLGVWNGLPPESFGTPPLNGPDFMVEIPLTDGENDFTLVGQPGTNTRYDEYERFAINLYFDSNLDQPGISVLFPRNNVPAGSPPSPNRSELIYSLGLNQVNAAPQMVYDDGANSVSVIAVSFLPPETFGRDVDLVSAQRLAPSDASDPNGSDYLGVLKLMVGPSSAPSGQAPPGSGAPGAGIIPSGIADSGTIHGPDIPIAGPHPQLIDPQATGDHAAAGAAEVRPEMAMAGGEAERTPPVVGTATPGTPTPATSPRPKVTGSVSPTADSGGTATPVATGSPTTPTPHASTTTTPATPTPNRH